MWNFGRSTKTERDRDDARSLKMQESQAALLNAAISTATAAQDVTVGLKARLDDVVKQFESTARILRDGLVLCTEDGTITTFNPAAERIFGIKSGLAVRQSIVDFFDCEAGVTDVPSLWALLQNDDQHDVLGVREGSTFPVRVTLSILNRHDESRMILLLVHDAVQDVPDNRYQSIFESSLDGIVVVLTQEGRMLAINPAVGRMFGYSPYELTNMNVSDLVVDRDRSRVASLCSSIDKFVPQHFTAEGQHTTGRVLNLIFTVAEIEWDGHTAILATIKDVTEIRKIESLVALKRDNGIDMVCSFDPTYRITFANQTFSDAMGIKRRELMGQDVRDFLSEIDRLNFVVGIGDLSAQNTVRRSITKSEANGEIVVQDWVDHGVFDEDGRAIEYQRIGRDISHALR